ncbi:hypothetical protein IFR04_000850 [Cadophora malorum]|uniref:Uncharacterized protein n=1 Tax=Cadophora malorum TaxID=108018 RepID=A0A8H7WJ82_9HELO|nr:hypothetical protein IFR04_000850 [Cadophora malorum]
MSHQPSTVESIKDTANIAYESIATTSRPRQQNGDYDPKQDKANFKKDTHGNTVEKGGLKDKLDEAATGGPGPKQESYIQKVAAYIPGMNKLQQSASHDQGGEEAKKPSGPPKRPDHDVQVERFLRDQYHSRSGDGMPDPSSKD